LVAKLVALLAVLPAVALLLQAVVAAAVV